MLLLIGCLGLYSAAEEDIVQTEVRLISMEQTIDGLYYKSGTRLEAARIPSRHLPRSFSYQGPAMFTLFRMGEGKDGRNQTVPAAQVTLPGEADQVLVMLSEVPKPSPEEMRYRAYATDVSLKQFPENSFWIWNLSERPVTGKLGDALLHIPKGERRIVQPDLGSSSRALDAKLVFADDESRKSYSSTKWFLNPGQRFIMILVEEESRKKEPVIRVKPLKL